MNLKYKILWYDDDENYVDSLDIVLEDIIEEISKWGFIAEIEVVTNIEKFKGNEPYQNYDLIVVDFNLQDDTYGDEFISNLRNHSVYTEVVFYSANPSSDLWNAIQSRKIEGVFVASRTNVANKIKLVAKQSVRKVLDIENMRGIVMAEVGDFDHLLGEIVSTGFSHLNDTDKQKILQRFHETAKQHADQGHEKLNKFIESPTIEAMLDLCDSNKRWESLQRLFKCHEKLKATKDRFGNYRDEILWPRNCLAHGTPSKQADGSAIFRFSNKEYHFNEEEGLLLRQRIVEYKKLFEDALKELST